MELWDLAYPELGNMPRKPVAVNGNNLLSKRIYLRLNIF